MQSLKEVIGVLVDDLQRQPLSPQVRYRFLECLGFYPVLDTSWACMLRERINSFLGWLEFSQVPTADDRTIVTAMLAQVYLDLDYYLGRDSLLSYVRRPSHGSPGPPGTHWEYDQNADGGGVFLVNDRKLP